MRAEDTSLIFDPDDVFRTHSPVTSVRNAHRPYLDFQVGISSLPDDIVNRQSHCSLRQPVHFDTSNRKEQTSPEAFGSQLAHI